MVCKKCGCALGADCVFCPTCGAQVKMVGTSGWFAPAGDLLEIETDEPNMTITQVSQEAKMSEESCDASGVQGIIDDTPSVIKSQQSGWQGGASNESVAYPNDTDARESEGVSFGFMPAGSLAEPELKAIQPRKQAVPEAKERPCVAVEAPEEKDQPNARVAQKKTCSKCGTALLNGGTVCPLCSRMSTRTTEAVLQETHTEPVVVDRPQKKKGWWFAIGVALLCGLVLVVVLLSQGGPKSEQEILADLEDEAHILVDGERMNLEVVEFEIEKRKTSNDTDEVYCKVRMESGAIGITAYRLLTYSKYNGNEWILEESSSYKEDVVEVIKDTEDLYNMAVQCAEKRDLLYSGFKNFATSYTATCEGNKILFNFAFFKKNGVAESSGNVVVSCALNGTSEKDYYWSTYVDDSAVKTSWDVDGTWQGHETNYGTGWYELTIQINSLTSDTVDCKWHYYNRGSWDKEHYYGDGSDCWVISCDAEKIEIGVQYGTALTSYLRVYFYADGTAQVEFPFVGVGDMSITNKKVQQENAGDTESKYDLFEVVVVDEKGTPLPKVKINLNQYPDTLVTTVETDSNGECLFALPEGQYSISLAEVPEGYEYSGDQEKFVFENGKNEVRIVLKKIPTQKPSTDPGNGEENTGNNTVDAGIFEYLGQDIGRAVDYLGPNYTEDYYEGGSCYIYTDPGVMLLYGWAGGTKVYAVMGYYDQVYGYGLTGKMTYDEIVKAAEQLGVSVQELPTGSYNEMDDCYEYRLCFALGNVSICFEWEDKQYTEKSDFVYVAIDPTGL